MYDNETSNEFIDLWGTIGAQWGISRTVARIHALLLLSTEPLDVEQIQEALAISRGNVSMSLRTLLDWELIYKQHRPGIRREFFTAEKDSWELARRIVTQRRRRELDPALKKLKELSDSTQLSNTTSPEQREFLKVTGDLIKLGKVSNQLLDLVMKLDRSTFVKRLLTSRKGRKS